ncbi:hypothetical protein SDC9_83502 [bioreactor metagenome]|uniref:Uncharacterized protein n=1 Tax=bioreactor metagenome TaxID=1076179 RepID=A0A644Z9E1_9ZZZZ
MAHALVEPGLALLHAVDGGDVGFGRWLQLVVERVRHIFPGAAPLQQCFAQFAIGVARSVDFLEQGDAFAGDQLRNYLARRFGIIGRLADIVAPGLEVADIGVEYGCLRAQPVLLHGVVPLHGGAQPGVVHRGELPGGVRQFLQPPYANPGDHDGDKENQAEGEGQAHTDLGIGESHQKSFRAGRERLILSIGNSF